MMVQLIVEQINNCWLIVYTVAFECPGPQWPTPRRKKEEEKKWKRVKGKHVGSLKPLEVTPAKGKVREG